MSSNLKVLVTGATGKQGGAVVDALLNSSIANSITIFAPTRDVNSASAKKLAAKSSNIKPVQGQMENATDLFTNIGEKVDTVFCVTVPSMKGGTEELEQNQGKNMIDASVANGVKHFVFTSVDRNGSESDENPTPVPHFISKHNIEKHLKEKAAAAGMSWTILRPVAFLDNFDPSFIGKVMASCWATMQQSSKLQLVSVRDIGIIAAKAIEDPEKFKNRAISLAGDDLTYEEADAVFKSIYGKPFPRSYSFLGWGVKTMVSEVGIMFKWFDDVGYGASVQECKEIHPGMQDLKAFLKSTDKFGPHQQ